MFVVKNITIPCLQDFLIYICLCLSKWCMFPREIIQINHMLTYFATALLSHCSDVHTPCKNKLVKIEPFHTLTQILLNVILEKEKNKNNDDTPQSQNVTPGVPLNKVSIKNING